jgi:hypothetical protein
MRQAHQADDRNILAQGRGLRNGGIGGGGHSGGLRQESAI